MRHIAEELVKGNRTSFRPRGNSMKPRIESGQRVTVEPCRMPKIGDVVLCKVNGRYLLHRVWAQRDTEFLIGNNRGKYNGWTRQIYGKVIEVSA